MMVQIYIIFDNNSFLLQDMNIQSDKHELLKRGFFPYFFFEKDIMNTNTFEMYSNTNSLHFSQKYSNSNTFKNVFKYL